MFTDYRQGQNISSLSIDSLGNNRFYHQNKYPIVRTSYLQELITLRKGDLYKRKDQQRTFKKLSNLTPYRFVSMSTFQDPDIDSLLHYNILLTPYEHKWVAEYGINLFYASVNNNDDGRQLLGFGVSTSFINRNFLRRAYRLSFDAEVSNEFEFSPAIKQSATTVNLQTNLQLPKQYDLLGFAKFMKFAGVLKGDRYQRFKDETRNSIFIGLQYSEY